MSETEPRFWDGLGPRLIVIAARLLLVLVILIFVLLRCQGRYCQFATPIYPRIGSRTSGDDTSSRTSGDDDVRLHLLDDRLRGLKQLR
jgi:hypothetical protein